MKFPEIRNLGKTHKILLGVALFQIGLFSLSFVKREGTGSFSAPLPIVTIEKEGIDKIEIKSGQETLFLVRDNDRWVLPDEDRFPASPDKVSNLLDSLAGLKRSWPVGKTMVAAKQFKTTDKDFVKRVNLYKGGKILHALTLGSSPSFKKAHLRVDDEKETYLVPFEAYSLNTNSKWWRDNDPSTPNAPSTSGSPNPTQIP